MGLKNPALLTFAKVFKMPLKWLRDGLRQWFAANPSQIYIRTANAKFAEGTTADMRVLDAGAGSQPYRRLFDHADYESADFDFIERKTPQTYVCDLTSIPVEDGRFDRVICNQVLEHLPAPSDALKELNRVLKPGGRIFCTCPLFYQEHWRPYDYYRYTQFGLRHLFQAAGFRVILIDWLEGFFGTVGYMFETMAKFLPRWADLRRAAGVAAPALWLPIFAIRIAALFLAGVFYRLDMRYKLVRLGFPKNYVVIAEKPGVRAHEVETEGGPDKASQFPG